MSMPPLIRPIPWPGELRPESALLPKVDTCRSRLFPYGLRDPFRVSNVASDVLGFLARHGIIPQQRLHQEEVRKEMPVDWWKRFPTARKFIVLDEFRLPRPFRYGEVYRELARISQVLVFLRRALRQIHGGPCHRAAQQRAEHRKKRRPIHEIPSRQRVVWCKHPTGRGRGGQLPRHPKEAAQ